MNKILKIILLLIVTVPTVYSQKINVHRLTTEEGLSSDKSDLLSSVIVDSRGYTWIATNDGLNRWDGYEMKVYKNNPFDPTSISSNAITALEEDQEGRIWIGTLDNGIDIFDYITNGFSHTDFMDNSKRIPRINQLLQARNGDMWIGTAYDGLYQLVASDSALIHRPIFEDSIANHHQRNIFDIFESHEGRITVTNLEDIHIFDKKNELFEHHYDSFCEEYTMMEDREGKIWHGCLYLKKLGIYNPADSTYVEKQMEGLGYVKEMILDRNNNLWMSGKNDGHVFLTKYNMSTGEKSDYFHDPADKTSIPNDFFSSMFEDQSGKIWFNTANAGAGYIDPFSSYFQKIYDDVAYNIFKDSDSTIFVSSSYRVDELNLKILSIKRLNQFDRYLTKYRDAFVQTIVKKKNGEYWFSVNEQPIMYSYNGKDTKSIGWAPHHLKSMVVDKDDNVHMAYKLQYYNDRQITKPNVLLEAKGSKILMRKEEYNECAQLYDGTLATGGLSNGLYHYNPSDTTLVHYSGENVSQGNLSSTTINLIYESPSSHKVYLGTNENINIWDRQLDTFTYINSWDGLRGKVLSMVEDNNQSIWALTSKGLHKIVDGKVTSFYDKKSGIEYGLESHFSYRMISDKENNIIFNTEAGVYRFNSDSLRSPFVPSPIRIENLYINRKLIQVGSHNSMTASLSEINHLYLPYRDRDIGFDFVSINGQDHGVEYQYRLRGYSDEWININEKRDLYFTNLNHGDYTLELKARSQEGAWTKENSSLKFTIDAPWYMKWWSYLLFTLLILSILYAIYSYRIYQITRYQKLRTKISSDLHDDVGTLLTSLSMQSDILGMDAPPEKQHKFEKFGNLSREAMDRMRDTVWAIDSRKDNMISLVDRMSDYISDMFEDHNVRVIFNHKETKLSASLAPDIRQNVYLIFKEALNNAMKHSNGDTVTISLVQYNKSLSLSVHDNGTIDKGKTSGTGISNMTLRAKRIGGELSINTHNGFEVLLQIK